MRTGHAEVSRDSNEYAEIIAEIFVETVTKSAGKIAGSDAQHDEITPSLMECLQYVYLHGPSPVREIACGLEISVSAASQLVDRLVKKDLVTRRENESDRRLTSVELTESGREAVRLMRQRRSEWFDSILRTMSGADRRALRDGLESFLKVALAGEENIDRACVRCGMEHVAFCVVNSVKRQRELARNDQDQEQLREESEL